MGRNEREEETHRKTGSEQVAKHTAKDSLFTHLFKEPKYLLQLYQALHPEDLEATEASISNVTISNVLLDQWYNDIGFQVGEKLLVLVECQSNWTVNIVVRCLLYLAQTYQEYIETTKQNVYGSKRINLPRPELYVIYTGNRKTRPEFLCLSEEFFGGLKSAVEVRVKMIYDGKEGDIINQYVNFTRIYQEQVRLHGRTREAVWKTIHICKDRHVLKDYLEGREKEVVDIMKILFDEEYILKTYVESKEREAAEEAAEAATERAAEEAEKRTKASAERLYHKGNSVDEIAEILDVSKEKVNEWLEIAVV